MGALDINWIDLLIIIVVIVIMLTSFKSGFIQTLAQLVGLVLGFSFAALYYPSASNYLIEYLQVTTGIADIISFILIFMLIYALVMSAGFLLRSITRFKPLRILDHLAGALVGIGFGIILVGALLLFMTSFPLFQEYDLPLEDSRFGSRVVNLTEILYHSAEDILPVNMPRLAFLPDEVEFGDTERSSPTFNREDFSRLDGTMCVDCEGEVDFEGIQLTEEGINSPLFICSICGRSSDGCQTFEGHHMLYDQCPAELGRKGYRTDCGMWPNGNFVRVTAECPVCN